MKLLAPFALCALASTALAQDVHFRGKIEDVSGTSQFVVDCTNVQLTSSSINLSGLVGQQVEIDGTWNGSFSSPSVEVTATTPVTDDFEIGGSTKIGEMAQVEVLSDPGDNVNVYGSLDPGFFPLPLTGAVLIDPSTAELIASGTVTVGGVLQLDSMIPNEPALVGLSYYGQAVVLELGGGVHMTTNDCVTFTM